MIHAYYDKSHNLHHNGCISDIDGLIINTQEGHHISKWCIGIDVLYYN